jgi:RHS repeat-associated protein
VVTAFVPGTPPSYSIQDSIDYLPFGEQVAGGSATTHKFTGDERDSETGLDHTWSRKYSSNVGRWMTPDPAGLAAVDPFNPQSWNRYSYVVNNPTNLIDPSGLDFCSGNSSYTTGGGGTNNLPTPDCIPTGIPSYFEADYNTQIQPVPDWNYFQGQTWQSVDTWFNNQGITEYAPLPTGVSNYNANQGDLGMLGSQEASIGFKDVVKRIIADWSDALWNNASVFVLFYLEGDLGGQGGAANAMEIDANVMAGLKAWNSVSVPSARPAPCTMNAGLTMGVWKAQLLAWIKSHPGQAPPPWLTTPPILSGVCG